MYQDKDSDLVFELDSDTDWFVNNDVYLYCYVKDFKIVKEEFRLDGTKYKLLNKYRKFTLKK